MSLPDPESGRRCSPLPVTTDRVSGVGIIVIHAVRTGTRMLRAAATTGLETIRHLHPEPLRGTKEVPLAKSPVSATVDAGHDVIDRLGTPAAVVDNHERDRFDLWVGDELVGVLGYLDERDLGLVAPSDRRVVSFMHTVVAEEWTGNGLGAILVREAFAHARNRDWTVRLVCSYAQGILTQTTPLRANHVHASPDHMIENI